MDTAHILQYLGLSGSVVVALGAVWYIVRRVIRSKCIRGDDGYALQLSFNTEEVNAIRNDAELRKMLEDLRGEVSRRSRDRTQASPPRTESQRPTVTVV